MNFQGITLLSVFTVLLVATYAFAGTIATQSKVNKLKTLDAPVTSPQTLIGMTLTGTGSAVEDVTLIFRNALANQTTVSVSIKDSAGVVIGSGSKTLTSALSTVTVNLTDTVTAAERPNLRKITVTAL